MMSNFLKHPVFCSYFGMSRQRFDHLLTLIGPKIQHKNNRRYTISASERLALTVPISAAGDSQQTAALGFRLGRATMCKTLKETCVAITIKGHFQ